MFAPNAIQDSTYQATKLAQTVAANSDLTALPALQTKHFIRLAQVVLNKNTSRKASVLTVQKFLIA